MTQVDEGIDKLLTGVGGVLLAGFGDSVIIGVLSSQVNRIKLGECRKMILANESLYTDVSPETWAKIAKVCQRVNLDKITVERLLKELKRKRQDLYEIITMMPSGQEWLNNQLADAKQRIHAKDSH